MQAEVGVDIFGYQGTFPVWADGLYMHDEVAFEGLLLPDSTPASADLSSDGQGIDPLTYSLSLFTGVDLQFTLEAYPRATGHLAGLRIEGGGATVLSEDESAHMDVPEENPGYLDLAVTYVADLQANLQIVLVPALAIGTPIGSFEVLSFEIPVDLIAYDEERPFAPIDIEHPLPSLQPPVTTWSFGEVEVGNLANAQFALTDVGLMDLEGTAHIEGDPAFTVYPTYFYATPGNEDGVVVTFAPTAAGDVTAVLVIESSDPVRPRLEIPLIGTGFSADDVPPDVISEPIKTCGCQSTSAPGVPIGGLVLAVMALRGRRRAG
jgi:MYXO-CTERM domain-containing protein